MRLAAAASTAAIVSKTNPSGIKERIILIRHGRRSSFRLLRMLAANSAWSRGICSCSYYARYLKQKIMQRCRGLGRILALRRRGQLLVNFDACRSGFPPIAFASIHKVMGSDPRLRGASLAGGGAQQGRD